MDLVDSGKRKQISARADIALSVRCMTRAIWCQRLGNYILFQDPMAPCAETCAIVRWITCHHERKVTRWLIKRNGVDLSDLLSEISTRARCFAVAARGAHELLTEQILNCGGQKCQKCVGLCSMRSHLHKTDRQFTTCCFNFETNCRQ